MYVLVHLCLQNLVERPSTSLLNNDFQHQSIFYVRVCIEVFDDHSVPLITVRLA